MFGWLKKPKVEAEPELTDKDLEDTLRGLVMAGLSKTHGLDPHYRTDVTSEADFEARSPVLPLIVVWNEHEAPQGLAFSMSVNKHLVEEMAEHFVERDGAWFLTVRNQVVEDLRTATFAAMMKACEATGLPPSIVCQSMAPG
jgi:hypothetical protein